jgi:O-methyltransferase involved in polyketide biosynthesis
LSASGSQLSASGSQLIAVSVPGNEEPPALLQHRIQQAQENWRKHGFDVEMTDLWYVGDRHNVADYLRDRGWTAEQTTMAHLYESYGQPLSESGQDILGLGSTSYVTAMRP